MSLAPSTSPVDRSGASSNRAKSFRPLNPVKVLDRLLDPFRILIRWSRINWLLYVSVIQWIWVTVGLRLGLRQDDSRPRILRRFLERAGGAWIKLGQILAMRSDFLPPRMIDELQELLDNVPPFPYKIAKEIIIDDLGRPIDEVFEHFPEKTIAAASFGQVYRAVLITGEEVAVKVMRPGLKLIVRSDLLQLRILAFFFDTFRLLGSIRLKTQIDQLEPILYEEIDYHFEADNIRRAVEQSRHFRILKIPRVYDDLCTSRVLTMEFLTGIWLNDILAAIHANDTEKLEEFEACGLNRKLAARRIFEIGLRQIFEIGNFHADPHAANIVVLEGNVIGYVDFGIVGQMDEELAESQGRYLQAVKDLRINDAARALSESVVIPQRLQRKLPEFRARLANQVRDWITMVNNPDSALRQKSIARLLLDNIMLIRKFRFELMENTMRYYRALIIADVIVLQLDPEFDTVRGLNRYFRRREIKQLRRAINPQTITWTSVDYFHLWLNGPRIARQVSRYLRRQEEEFGVVSAQYVALYRAFARGFILAFIAVIIARVLGVPDVATVIRFPFSLDWRWFAPFLLICWRVFSIVGR